MAFFTVTTWSLFVLTLCCNHLLFVLHRFVVSCSAWKSCPETDAEKLVQQVFHAFHDMMQLMETPHL